MFVVVSPEYILYQFLTLQYKYKAALCFTWVVLTLIGEDFALYVLTIPMLYNVLIYM